MDIWSLLDKFSSIMIGKHSTIMFRVFIVYIYLSLSGGQLDIKSSVLNIENKMNVNTEEQKKRLAEYNDYRVVTEGRISALENRRGWPRQ